MKNKLFVTSITLFALFGGTTQPAFAVSTPDFGSCLNPQIAASQVNNGDNHGVVGQIASYKGTDTIYTLSNGNVLQCLCPDNGSGIQTNWLKVNDLSETDVNILKNEGWIYVATGSSWGLEDVAYLAKNSNFSCRSESTSTSSSSSNSSSSEQKVEGQVLGLASTGSEVAIYGLILAGITSLIAGLLLNKFSK